MKAPALHKTPALIARIRELIASGMTTCATAREVGVSPTTVCKWCRQEGIARMTHAEAVRAMYGPPRKRAPREHIDESIVPHWVPDHLSKRYISITARSGQFKAAQVVRALKRGISEERAS